jgi:hypothetical protein
MTMTYSDDFNLKMLQWLTGLGGLLASPLSSAKVALYTNNIAITPRMKPADFTEPTFAGYTAGGTAIVWANVMHSSQTLNYIAYGNAVTFLRSGGIVNDTVRGYVIWVTGGGAFMIAARPLDTFETIEDGGGLIIVPRVGFDTVAQIPDGDVTVT